MGAYADSKPTVDRRIIDKAAAEALDAADFGKIRRARYERAALVGIGLAVGATLVGVVGLSLNRGERGAPRAELAANASPAPTALVAAPAATPIPTAVAPVPTAAPEPTPQPITVAREPAKPASFDLRAGFASLVGADKESWQELATPVEHRAG